MGILDVDLKGLGGLVDVVRAPVELIANSWDEDGCTDVRVTFEPVPGQSRVTLIVDDNAPAASPTPEDAPFFEDEVLLPPLGDRGDNSYASATPSTVGSLPLPFVCEPGIRDLWLIIITADATTHTATASRR